MFSSGLLRAGDNNEAIKQEFTPKPYPITLLHLNLT